MDIVTFVSSVVASMNDVPSFIHGEKAWQNLQDNVDLTSGVVYLDEPITSTDTLHLSGYLEVTYPLRLFFAKKSEMDYTPAQMLPIIQACREWRREFIVRLQESATTMSIANIRTIDVLRAYDLNVTGVILQIDLTPISRDSNCFD